MVIPAEAISLQPLVYGPPGGLRIYLEAVFREDPDLDKISFTELDSLANGAINFYREFASVDRGWAPSVNVLLKGYDGIQEHGDVGRGWVGRPLTGTQ